MKYFIFLTYTFLIIQGCELGNKRNTKKIIDKYINKEITFFNNNLFYLNGKDTIIDKTEKGEFKLIVFADSSDCEICDFRLGEWFLKRKEILFYNDNVNFIFIIQSKNYRQFENYAHETIPNTPFIYDPKGIFIKKMIFLKTKNFILF